MTIAYRLPIARMFAVIEAVMGQCYLAVVIAWLVSAAERKSPSSGRRNADG